MDLKIVLSLVLTIWVSTQPLRASALSAASLPEAVAISEVEIEPMSDPAIMGAACLGMAAMTMAVAYGIGPVETMMLVSGSPVVPNSAVLFIPMFGVLGGGSCALAAAATPGVRWMIDQSSTIAGQLGALINDWLEPLPPEDTSVSAAEPGELGELGGRYQEDIVSGFPPIRPMTETEFQSTGCLIGALSGFTASMVTSPMEVAMLSSGTTVIVSSTPVLGLGLLATIVGAGCGIGSLVSTPVIEFLNGFDTDN